MSFRIRGKIADWSDTFVSGGGLVVTDSGGEPITSITAGAQTGISDNTLTTVATLTANGTDRLVQVTCSGTGYAKFQVFLNSTLIDTKRSGPDRNVMFQYDHPLKLTAADVVDVKVTHYNVGVSEDFEAYIFGFHSV